MGDQQAAVTWPELVAATSLAAMPRCFRDPMPIRRNIIDG